MDFQNLDEYYEYLENDINFQYLDLNTYKFITALRDKSDDENTKKLCSYELFFADFSIEEGKHIPKFQSGSNAYPTLELFDDNFEYIKTRGNKVQNPKYKAKYNHLLWLSPQKHIDFAKNAIESYLLLLQNSSFSFDDNLQCYSFGKYYKNLFALSQKVNFKKDEIITYFVSLLESEKLNDFTKYSLMEFIVQNGNNVNFSIKQTFFDYSKNRIEHLSDRELESYLNLLVFLCQKLNISSSIFNEKLGDFHISQLEKENIKGFIAHHYYIKALEEYKKANNKEKIEQTSVLLEKAKKTIDLKRITVSSEDDEELQKHINQWWDSIKTIVNEIVEKYDSKVIYQYLIKKDIFSKADKLNEVFRSSFRDLIPTMSFDINYNVIKKKETGINSYYFHVNNFSIKHIWLVFSEGIRNNKLSFESLIKYLKYNSWYGQDFTYLDVNRETKGFNWIAFSSFTKFFIQTEIDIKTKKDSAQGYILAIDSLVLKFEGLLRELSRMIGAQTIDINDNGTEERIKIDKLLDNEKLKSLIPEDDFAYFKFLFTQQGLNLRNNIAHSFYRTSNYTSAIMLLLIVALLKLGNYKLE